jgi:hypothetical protein
MPRMAIAVLLAALVLHSADGATMKGTLTLDDGRVMMLVVGRVHERGSRNVTVKDGRLRCDGEACFAPRGHFGYTLPLPSQVGVTFDNRYSVTFPVACGTPSPLSPGCHIHEVVTCAVFKKAGGYVPVAAGTLDLHRVMPKCRRSLHQARE